MPASPLPAGRELELLRRSSEPLKARLRNETAEPDVREAGRAYLDARLAGTDGQDPFGAAVVMTAVGMSVPYRDHDMLAPVADDWVARVGYGFAAAATVELAGLALRGTSGAYGDEVGVVRISKAGHRDRYLPHWFVIAVRLRTLLASATDEGHAAAEAALSNYREGWLPEHRALTSFLLPDRLDWVADDCATASPDFFVARPLGAAAHSVEQVRALDQAGRLAEADRNLPLLATLMIGVGPAIAPVLHDWLNWSTHGASTAGYRAPPGNWRRRRPPSPAGTNSTCCRPCCTWPATVPGTCCRRSCPTRPVTWRSSPPTGTRGSSRCGRSPRRGWRGIRRSRPVRWCRPRSVSPASRGARPNRRCG